MLFAPRRQPYISRLNSALEYCACTACLFAAAFRSLDEGCRLRYCGLHRLFICGGCLRSGGLFRLFCPRRLPRRVRACDGEARLPAAAAFAAFHACGVGTPFGGGGRACVCVCMYYNKIFLKSQKDCGGAGVLFYLRAVFYYNDRHGYEQGRPRGRTE